MPDRESLLQEVRDNVVQIVEQMRTAFRRIEANEGDIKSLEIRAVENEKAIAAQNQWMHDMERREQIGLALMTVVLTAMIWLSNLLLR